MKFQVPIEKDLAFTQELFSLLSENISDLVGEYEKLPSKIVFMGNLGRELLAFIQEKEWNFKGFELESANSTLDALIFKYSAPLTQVDGRMGALFDGGTLHGKEISGIPGPETTQKIISTYASPSFILERTVRPEKRILLVRK
jgi:hypothetical protein